MKLHNKNKWKILIYKLQKEGDVFEEKKYWILDIILLDE